MKLHQMTADQILEQIEHRSDLLATAELEASNAETQLKALEASQAIAFRDSGMSMAEAEKRLRTSQEWADAYGLAQAASIEAAKVKRDYQRALIASDLWRSEQSTLRAIS